MIDQHTLETLEFPKIVAAIRGKCLTAYGGSEVDRIRPLFDKAEIERKQAEISQMKDIIKFGSAFPLYRLEDCREHLDRSLVDGIHLDPSDILKVLELVEVSMAVHRYDKEGREKFPAVAVYLPQIRSFPELKKDINKAIDESGEIKDNATQTLKHIRIELYDCRRKIIARLEGILAGQKKQAGWQDDVVTQRNGRYVIPVLASQYSHSIGILHDRSQSGATFFIEPTETVELNNQINRLYQDERLEMDRILRALTAAIAERAEPLHENCRIMGILDAIHAAAKFAVQVDANSPSIASQPRFRLVEARHPLLIQQFERKEDVIPLGLELGDSRQSILITGPNTGGKTIALKTIGLMVLMAQSGLPIPASDKSEMGIFQQVFADIGDEQSIELSLSTFSSHVKNIVAATEMISPDTLVLLDEIGAGTDPKEGAALAEAIILHMLERGTRLIATTHYSHLKTLALDHAEIENASLEFDRRSLAPTYRLQMGIPGSSYAVEIASRLGMPKEVCEKASTLLGPGERSLSDLIESLESELARVRDDRTKLTDRLERAKELEEYYRIQSKKLRSEIEEKRKNSLKETDQLLEETRKETERLVADIRHSQASERSVKKLHRTVKKSKDKVRHLRGKTESRRKQSFDPSRFGKGDAVRIISLNQEGEIEDLIGNGKARIRVGNVTTVVELRNLEKLSGLSKGKAKGAGTSYSHEVATSPEIHLRGMTGEEALEALEKFLDNAVISGLHQVYVIHGKGTGTLRRMLTDYLKGHPEVVGVRLGDWNEGGAGVTIVKLKE